MSQEELLELFEQGEIPAQPINYNGAKEQLQQEAFFIHDMYQEITIDTLWSNLDTDEEAELIVQGPYGGTYFDVRDGIVYAMASGYSTANVLSFAEYDDKVWIVESDTTHGGRVCYHFYHFDDTGTVIEEFTLNKFYWEHPGEPDSPDTMYEYNGEEISKMEYERILSLIEMTYTTQWN